MFLMDIPGWEIKKRNFLAPGWNWIAQHCIIAPWTLHFGKAGGHWTPRVFFSRTTQNHQGWRRPLGSLGPTEKTQLWETQEESGVQGKGKIPESPGAASFRHHQVPSLLTLWGIPNVQGFSTGISLENPDIGSSPWTVAWQWWNLPLVWQSPLPWWKPSTKFICSAVWGWIPPASQGDGFGVNTLGSISPLLPKMSLHVCNTHFPPPAHGFSLLPPAVCSSCWGNQLSVFS